MIGSRPTVGAAYFFRFCSSRARASATTFSATFRETRRQLIAGNKTVEEIRDALENVKGLYLNNGLLTNSPTEHAGYDPSGQFVMTVRDGAFHLVK